MFLEAYFGMDSGLVLLSLRTQQNIIQVKKRRKVLKLEYIVISPGKIDQVVVAFQHQRK
jgi:hypothetical protein